jgi:TPR repeat protein
MTGTAIAACSSADSEGNFSATKHVECLHQEADQGDSLSQFILASFYFGGRGIPQNYAEASKWYLRAANQGHMGAQFFLGGMYAKCQGVPRDLVRAHMWFNLAAAQDLPDASELRDKASELRHKVEGQMTAAQIAEAQKLASEFKPKPER